MEGPLAAGVASSSCTVPMRLGKRLLDRNKRGIFSQSSFFVGRKNDIVVLLFLCTVDGVRLIVEAILKNFFQFSIAFKHIYVLSLVNSSGRS